MEVDCLSLNRDALIILRATLRASYGQFDCEKWKNGYTILCTVLKEKDIEFAKELLTYGCKVNIGRNCGSPTPLHYAVTSGHIEIVEMLLGRGANANAKSTHHITPLHNAVKKNRMEITKLLLSGGANVDAKKKNGETALHIAAEKGYLKIVELLLKHGANVNSLYSRSITECYTPVYLAVINRHKKVVKLLLQYGANVDTTHMHDKTILYVAVEKGHSAIIQHILKHRPDRNNKSNRSALNVAVHGKVTNYRKIVENLHQYGLTINPERTNIRKLLYTTVRKGYLTIVEDLLKYGVDVNTLDDSENGCTPLHVAIRSKREEVAILLIGSGADLNAKDLAGRTPIFSAVEKNSREIIEVLLEHHADVNSTGKNCQTPLHVACKIGNLEIVEVLLKFGSSVYSRDANGRTALHIAAEFNRLKIVDVLLKFGPTIDAKDRYGRTALRIACDIESGDITTALLEYGFDMSIAFSCCGKVISEYSPTDTSSTENIILILNRHVVKVRTANLHVSEELPPIWWDNEIFFRDDCKEEVARMKSEKVGDANISFYDILTKGINQLAIYAGIESIVEAFGSGDYKTKFPIYAPMINGKFRQGERRKELMKQGNKIFHFLFTEFLGIPHDCTEKIFNYLSDEDLRTIMDACKGIM